MMTDNNRNYVHCMLIPLQQHYLLLPNSVVTEVIPHIHADKTELTSFDWLAMFHWENQRIPLIEIEMLLSIRYQESVFKDKKLCILKSLNKNSSFQHFAIPCSGSQQLITLNTSALQISSEQIDSQYLHSQINIGNKIALIPNLDQLELSIQNAQQ